MTGSALIAKDSQRQHADFWYPIDFASLTVMLLRKAAPMQAPRRLDRVIPVARACLRNRRGVELPPASDKSAIWRNPDAIHFRISRIFNNLIAPLMRNPFLWSNAGPKWRSPA